MKKFRIAFFDNMPSNNCYQELLGANGEVNEYIVNEEVRLPEDLSAYDGVIVGRGLQITTTTLSRLTKCKVIVRDGVGYNNIDVYSANRLGIPVINVSEYCVNDVADHAIALLLSYARKIVTFNLCQTDISSWWDSKLNIKINKLEGQSIGIVGFGRIGKAIANRASAMKMDVYYYDPYVQTSNESIRKSDDLADIFKRCKYVSLNLPLTKETVNIIDENILRIARKDLVLINVSRGKLVDLSAIYQAFLENSIEAFLSDVFPDEPPDPTLPLIKAYIKQSDNVRGRLIFTPHIAYLTEEGNVIVQETAVKNLLLALNENEYVGRVN